MAILDGVDADLRKRIEAMIAGCPRLWVSSGLRTRAEQQRLYDAYLNGTGAPANKPGTSMHEKGLAVDVGATAADERIRRDLAARHGLVVPHPAEPWHMELDPSRKPLVAPVSTKPQSKRTEEEEELPRYADKYVWPDGTSVQVFPDGAVKNFGSKHKGSMHSLKSEHKRSFTRADSIRPVDPTNSQEGYIIGNENGDEYQFDQDADKYFK